ncbi:hypothetical protein ID1001_13660 [Helicobacter pylori]
MVLRELVSFCDPFLVFQGAENEIQLYNRSFYMKKDQNESNTTKSIIEVVTEVTYKKAEKC